MHDLVITGAQILGGPSADIAIADGHIVAVGACGGDGAKERIDAAGLIALPGLVDPHTHLREPGKTDAETVRTGTRAAAAGGFTAVAAMANTTPVTDTVERAEFIRDRAAEHGLCDVSVIGAVTCGLQGEQLSDMRGMASSRAQSRMFSDDGMCVSDSLIMRQALAEAASLDAVIAQHAQDPRLAPHSACCHEGEVSCATGMVGWPAVAEEAIIARDVLLAESTGARLHVCHVSTGGSVDVVRWAKRRGISVTAEATPHHLLLTTDLVKTLDPVYKVNPPLRPHEDVMALREGLADGTIDMIGTVHAPHLASDKAKPFADAAFGMMGLEAAVSVITHALVREGLLTWADVARVMSQTPARLLQLSQHGGSLKVGEPAHITLVDPSVTKTIDGSTTASKSRNNPWHGATLSGQVELTVWKGVVTARAGLPVEPDVAPAAP